MATTTSRDFTYRDFLRPLRIPAYAFLVSMLVFQIVDFVQSVMPLRPTVLLWRFATLGGITNNVGNILLLLLIIFALLLLFSDWQPLVVIAVMTGVGSVFLLVCAGAFSLDVIQLRARVDPAAVVKFDLASALALVKYLVDSVLCAVIAFGALRSWRLAKREAMRERGNDDFLIVRAAGGSRPTPAPIAAIKTAPVAPENPDIK